jgi:NAD(P)-dependent dehydrogenase (short-subunit alcohol dehydrogenase family)
MALLNQKRIVIIAGTSGIGFATAKLAAENGASLIITGLNENKLQEATKQIHGDVEAFQLEIADEATVKTFFDKIGTFDYLTTPGSVVPKGPFLSTDYNTTKVGFDSKFGGQYHAAKYGVPYMKPGGAIVFFSGVVSHRPQSNLSVMAAVNSAVEGLGRALAIELAPIRVNVVAPGIIDTPRYAGMAEVDRAAMFAHLSEKLPVKHIGQSEEEPRRYYF